MGYCSNAVCRDLQVPETVVTGNSTCNKQQLCYFATILANPGKGDGKLVVALTRRKQS